MGSSSVQRALIFLTVVLACSVQLGQAAIGRLVRQALAIGQGLLAGVDEAGRGPLAGPVVAAAVILPHNLKAPWRREVRDSKQLRPTAREYLFEKIKGVAVAVGTGMMSHEVIDSAGIATATRLAMAAAIERLVG